MLKPAKLATLPPEVLAFVVPLSDPEPGLAAIATETGKVPLTGEPPVSWTVTEAAIGAPPVVLAGWAVTTRRAATPPLLTLKGVLVAPRRPAALAAKV
jgi:hypothetical protein